MSASRLHTKKAFPHQKSNARSQRQRQLKLERLEDRIVLSTIDWTNRSVSDDFDSIYGDDAEVARRIVHRAIADWEEVIESFNYADEGIEEFELEVEARAFRDGDDGGLRGRTATFDSRVDSSGKPYTGRIVLDDNGGGAGWYFDPKIRENLRNVADDSEFTTIINPFAAEADLPGSDFYRTVLHELGHALGLASSLGENDIDRFLSIPDVDPPFVDPMHQYEYVLAFNVGGGDVEATFTSAGELHLLHGPASPEMIAYGLSDHPYDLMVSGDVTGRGDETRNIRQLISDLDATILAQAYGYSVRLPSTINSFHSNLDTHTGDLVVTGTNVADDILISHSGTTTTIYVNGFSESFHDNDLETITINALDGSDVITISSSSNHIPIEINAGQGADEINVGTGQFNRLGRGLLTVNGDEGDDTVTIFDHLSAGDTREYRIGSSAFARGAADQRTVVNFGDVEDIVLQANEEGTTFRVDHVELGTTVAIVDFGTDDLDNYQIGQGLQTMDEIRGELFLSPGDEDHVSLIDRQSFTGSSGGHSYTIRETDFGGARLRLGPLRGKIDITNPRIGSDELSIDFVTSALDDSVQFRSSPANIAWSIFDEGGRDTLYVGENELDAVRGPITFFGNGDDEIVVTDAAADSGRRYEIEPRSSDYDLLHFQGDFDLRYENVDEIDIRSGNGADRVVVPDQFPNLFFDGGGGVDTLDVEARNGGAGDFVVYEDRFSRQRFGVPNVEADHDNIERLELTTSSSFANRVLVVGFDGDISISPSDFDSINLGDGPSLDDGGTLETIHGDISISGSGDEGVAVNIFVELNRFTFLWSLRLAPVHSRVRDCRFLSRQR